MWAEHERLEEHITDQSCKAEIQSFAERGQQIPVLGRRIKDPADSMCDVELIYGARRLYVARQLNMPLRVEIRELSDREAAIAMDIENRQRCDPSAYERGCSYQRLLSGRVFSSQDELAAALRVSASQVSRLLKLAALPSVILDAFRSPLEIREIWGIDLHQAWQDRERREIIGETARAIIGESPRPDAAQVYERLMGPPPGRLRVRSADEVVRDGDGRPLFRMRYVRGNLSIILNADQLSRESLDVLKLLIKERLQHASQQAVDPRADTAGAKAVHASGNAQRCRAQEVGRSKSLHSVFMAQPIPPQPV
jgi:ParB family chromosome partitioning protein